jgi:hypothetical protein
MTTAMVRCTQPGCDGTIQDGYCMTCCLAFGPVDRNLGGNANLSVAIPRNAHALVSTIQQLSWAHRNPGATEFV